MPVVWGICLHRALCVQAQWAPKGCKRLVVRWRSTVFPTHANFGPKFMVATWCRPSHDPMDVEPFGWNWFSEVPSRLGFTLWGCSRVTARQRVVCWLLMSISLHGIAIVSDYWYLASFQKSMFHHVSPFFCEGFPSPASLRIPGDDLALTTKVGCWHVWLCRRARTDHSRCRRKTTRLHLVVGPKYPKLWAKQFEVYSSRIGTGNRISFSFSWSVQCYNSLSCFELLYRMAKS